MSDLLTVKNLEAYYGDFQALFGVDVNVSDGETVAIIGANGSGKSTFLKCLAGMLTNRADSIVFDGAAIGDRPASEILRLGIALIPEGRQLFPSLSVEENLLVGGYGGERRLPWNLETVFDLFPALKDLRNTMATLLSGGQQQMVAIGRALMSNPRLLLCDEISLGLAPIIVEDIYRILPRIKKLGTGIVLVEQDVGRALRAAERVYCMQEGRVTLSGNASALSREAIRLAYFGI